MSEHQPEPWVTVRDNEMQTAMWEAFGHQSLRIVFADEGSDVAYIPPCDGDNGNADAKRIVDCVNACKGIEDPVTTVSELVATMAELVVSYQAELYNEYATTRNPNPTLPVLHRARAVLAKAGKTR